MTDSRDQAGRLIAINRDDCFGRLSKPAAVRRKPIASDWFTPRGVVVSALIGSTLFLDDDPGVNRKDAPPPHGPSSIYPNERLGMARCRRQKSGAGAVGCLPIAAVVSKPIIAASRNSDRHHDQQ
jgi:hypothetical protein